MREAMQLESPTQDSLCTRQFIFFLSLFIDYIVFRERESERDSEGKREKEGGGGKEGEETMRKERRERWKLW